jgi:cytochrome c2
MGSLKIRNNTMSKTFFLFAAILFSLSIFSKSFAQDGQKLFKANCGVCHSVGKGKLVGPDLKGVDTRHDEAWLLKWIKSSQTMIKAGDKTAVQLYNDNSNLVMQDFNLNDDEIKSVLAYVKEKEQQIAASAQNATTDNSVSFHNSTEHTNMLSMFGFSGYIMIFLTSLLMIIIWVMGMSIKQITADIKKNKS